MNAASRGTRRAMMETWLTREHARTSRTGGGREEHAGDVKRDVSVPMMDTWERVEGGKGAV